MERLYVRDEDWADHVGKKFRIIRGTEDIIGTMQGLDEILSPTQSGEMVKAWLLRAENGNQVGFVPSDKWDIYEL